MPFDAGGGIEGGWWVFLALAALWIGLVLEHRTRVLASILEEALKAADLQTPERAERPPSGELERLAQAVSGEGTDSPATADPAAPVVEPASASNRKT